MKNSLLITCFLTKYTFLKKKFILFNISQENYGKTLNNNVNELNIFANIAVFYVEILWKNRLNRVHGLQNDCHSIVKINNLIIDIDSKY